MRGHDLKGLNSVYTVCYIFFNFIQTNAAVILLSPPWQSSIYTVIISALLSAAAQKKNIQAPSVRDSHRFGPFYPASLKLQCSCTRLRSRLWELSSLSPPHTAAVFVLLFCLPLFCRLEPQCGRKHRLTIGSFHIPLLARLYLWKAPLLLSTKITCRT